MKALTEPRGVVANATRGTTVLLVDDREANLVALKEILRPLDLRLLTAGSGDEALKALLRNDIALILLDVQMPDLDGFQTAAYIKQLRKTRDIPIIFLTAINKDETHVFRGYTAGAVDYLFKPFDPTVLRSKVSVFVDLYEKKKALQQSEERFHKAFENAPIGVALVGLRGNLIEANHALCNMLGYGEAELASLMLRDLSHPDEPEIDLAHLRRSLAEEGAALHTEKRFVSRDGAELDTLVSVSYIEAGDAPHFILQITDVTQKKRLEEFRQRFVANAAHELRTPVAVISGTSSLMRKGELTPEQLERCTQALDRQTQRLVRLVDSLLDLTRLQEGHFVVDLAPVRIIDVVTAVLEATPAPADKRVEVDVASGLVAMTDANALDQMIGNLVVNAFRYGGDLVSIRANLHDDVVVLSVEDDGEGVPDELLPRLFEPFARGKSSVKVGGSGLGLALVKSLAQAIGGEISYAKEDGRSTFTLIIGGPR
jgi:PAS domain S-box-containing protein